MAKLIYSVIMSLDGYIADESGNFAWAAPDEEVHAFVNGRSFPRHNSHKRDGPWDATSR